MTTQTSTPKAADKKARVRKSDGEKAQHAYDVALRRTKKAEALRDSLRAQQQAAQADYEAAKKRSDFLANDPDLPKKATVDSVLDTAATVHP